VKGCVPVDVSVYDIPRKMKESTAPIPEMFKQAFGETEQSHREYSPVTYVAKGKNIPAFLILHVADRPDTKAQSQHFADKLREAGVPAQVVAAEGKTHGTINSDLGKPADPPTLAIYKFLEDVMQQRPSPQVHAYVESKDADRMLDVYPAEAGKNRPIVFWIHGGGWKQGDKNDVQVKPRAFLDRGFAFVSTNYRLFPSVNIKVMAGDLAKAIRWTHDHAHEFGGDPSRIYVMGHSAGASLAALVCTDDRYLKAEGLPLSSIKGCVPVDGDAYDVPLQIATVDRHRASLYKWEFGEEADQKELSPITYVAKGKGIPPFLILHVADHPEVKAQSEKLAKALQDAGIQARAFPAEGKIHSTLNADLGLPDDPSTRAVWEFIEGTLKH
jgi:acetyl esterase/lipase